MDDFNSYLLLTFFMYACVLVKLIVLDSLLSEIKKVGIFEKKIMPEKNQEIYFLIKSKNLIFF